MICLYLFTGALPHLTLVSGAGLPVSGHGRLLRSEEHSTLSDTIYLVDHAVAVQSKDVTASDVKDELDCDQDCQIRIRLKATFKRSGCDKGDPDNATLDTWKNLGGDAFTAMRDLCRKVKQGNGDASEVAMCRDTETTGPAKCDIPSYQELDQTNCEWFHPSRGVCNSALINQTCTVGSATGLCREEILHDGESAKYVCTDCPPFPPTTTTPATTTAAATTTTDDDADDDDDSLGAQSADAAADAGGQAMDKAQEAAELKMKMYLMAGCAAAFSFCMLCCCVYCYCRKKGKPKAEEKAKPEPKKKEKAEEWEEWEEEDDGDDDDEEGVTYSERLKEKGLNLEVRLNNVNYTAMNEDADKPSGQIFMKVFKDSLQQSLVDVIKNPTLKKDLVNVDLEKEQSIGFNIKEDDNKFPMKAMRAVANTLADRYKTQFFMQQALNTCIRKLPEVNTIKADGGSPIYVSKFSHVYIDGIKIRYSPPLSLPLEELQDNKGKKGKDKGKGKKGKKGKGKGEGTEEGQVQKKDEFLLAQALRLQKIFRLYRLKSKRQVQNKQKLIIICNAIQATDLPSVNTFGGIDPLMEFRAVYGANPNDKKGGNVKAAATNSVKTKHKEAEVNPRWDEKLELKGCANKPDHFVQVVIWDYNMTGNTAVCHLAYSVPDAIRGLCLEQGQGELETNRKRIVEFYNCRSDKPLKTTAEVAFSIVELRAYHLIIKKADKLPAVKVAGGIAPFIEARLIRKNPKKMDDQVKIPKEDLVWSGKTASGHDFDPKWNKEFPPIEVGGYATYWWQFVLFDDCSPMPPNPICHCLMPCLEVGAGKPLCEGGEKKTKVFNFERLEGIQATKEIRKGELTIIIGYDYLFDR